MAREHSAINWLVVLAVVSILCGPSAADTWLSDNFDSYSAGSLSGQGGWFGAVGPVKVETSFVESGKSVEADYRTWGVGDVSRTVSSGGGYCYVEFDAAMDTAGPEPTQNLGYLKILSPTMAEITRVYYAHQQFKVLSPPTNQVIVQDNVPARTWFHIKLGIDLTTSKMDVWVDGVQKLAGGNTYASGTSIGSVIFGQWSSLGSTFTKSETYIDNLECYGPPSPGVATLLLSGTDVSGWEIKNVSHPYVVYDTAAGNYKMYYCSGGQCEVNESSWDQWRTGVATSPDTQTWTRKTDDYEPVLYPRIFHQGEVVDADENKLVFDSMFAFDPCVVKDGSTYKMWYTGWNGESEELGGGLQNKINFRIGLATSTNMIAWTKQPGLAGGGSVFGPGSAGAQDAKGVGDPSVIKEGSLYRMWYEGFDGTMWRVFYATSADGATWTRQGVALNPGAGGALDALGVRYPVVITRNGQYELWYQGKSATSPNYHVMRATSSNGLAWTKVAGEVALHPSDSLDGVEQIHVDSILVQPDSSCQVFFSKENTTNVVATYATIADRRCHIYSEVVAL